MLLGKIAKVSMKMTIIVIIVDRATRGASKIVQHMEGLQQMWSENHFKTVCRSSEGFKLRKDQIGPIEGNVHTDAMYMKFAMMIVKMMTTEMA